MCPLTLPFLIFPFECQDFLVLLSKWRLLPRHQGDGAFIERAYNSHNGGFPMQYLLSLYSDESVWPTMTEEQKKQGYAAYMAYTEALKQAGTFVGSNRLQPTSTATTVRSTNGKSQVL